MAIIYRDTSGTPIKAQELCKLQSDFCEGYSAYDIDLEIAIFEAKGRRFRQEDRLTIGTLPPIGHLTTSQKEMALRKTFATLQEQISNLYPEVGSTAIISLIEPNTVLTAWVGDSVSFLVVFNESDKLEIFEHLNKNLHRPNPVTKEGLRVKKIASAHHLPLPYEHFPGIWRTGDGLALSRALGDKYSEPFGVTHDPEMSEVKYSIQKGRGFIITACDGLTEAMTYKELQQFVSSSNHNQLEELAKRLVYRALNLEERDSSKQSFDNISVVLTRLQPNLPTRIVALFDGHNGSFISETLSHYFLPLFKKELQSVADS